MERRARRHDLDNLRSAMILLLFPVHTFMIWNDYGAKFYVWGGESRLLSALIVGVNPWFMPVLFAIAGISARYSIEARGRAGFAKERLRKVLLPFVSGLLLLVPVQTFYARRFFSGYDGGYLENYRYFFTHLTDFSGYDGGFTPGHLWFLLFLFIIALLGLAVAGFIPYEKIAPRVERFGLSALLLLFVPVWLFYYLGNFGGYSLGKNLALYLLGYYVLSNEAVAATLDRHRRLIWILFALVQTALVCAYGAAAFYGDFAVNLVCWLGVLACLTAGRRRLNRQTRLSAYLRRASFPVYLLHQSLLVALGYYVLRGVQGRLLQVAVILPGSLLLSVAGYELLRRVPILRRLFGIPKGG